MSDPIPIPTSHNRWRIPTPPPFAHPTPYPSPSKVRYTAVTSWYLNETEKVWQSAQTDGGASSTSTMPIPTTPRIITREIRKIVARAFDRLEDGEGEEVVGVDVDVVKGIVEGVEVEVTQKAVCCVIAYSGDGEKGRWAFEEGSRVVDWEGISEQCVRNLCHFLPEVRGELGIEEEVEGEEGGEDAIEGGGGVGEGEVVEGG